ncbi:zinc transporter ZIP12-like [Amphiura filiformis]|uniref:zinc transporter ZIP12-like n=1 Tax=Amphiura filiformis TaxID=82378 RepID=UPI003B219D84
MGLLEQYWSMILNYYWKILALAVDRKDTPLTVMDIVHGAKKLIKNSLKLIIEKGAKMLRSKNKGAGDRRKQYQPQRTLLTYTWITVMIMIMIMNGIMVNTSNSDNATHIMNSLTYMKLKKDIGSESTFNTLCPALVEQIVSKACEGRPVKRTPDQSAMVYGWATLAVFLITLCSMIGIIIVPLASVKVYTGIMHLFVALAVSTLSGDALLHLIPEALGLHGHNDHQHQAEQAATPEQVLSKVLVVVAAIYAFFLFERVMMVCLGKNPHVDDPKRDKLGELAESPNEYTPAMFQAGNTIEMDDIIDDMPQFSDIDHIDRYSTPADLPTPPPPNTDTDGDMDDGSSDFVNIPDNAQYQSHELTDTLFVERKKKELSTRTSFSFTKGMQSISIMVLVADAVHNVTDGIAIGVAFTLDAYVGISTCLAVFCHELPHEIGDFAVLLKNGLNFRTAFF